MIELEFRGIEKPLDGDQAFLVAEIGINHNGDLTLAKEAIAAAAESGADAVKFQNYRTDDFLLDQSLMYTYQNNGQDITESQYAMFKRCELTFAQLAELAAHAARQGVIMFATPSGRAGVDEIVQLGLPLIKNASDSLTNVVLLRAMARTGLPCVLSTGMATPGEIRLAVDTMHTAQNQNLVLCVCTSMYPTPPEQVHLRRIPTLRDTFKCPVGFSDHTAGWAAAVGAVSLGATYIEKHFTLDKSLPGPDHQFSADPDEWRDLVKAVRDVESALGVESLGLTPGEEMARESFGLSLCVSHNLPSGHVLTEADFAFLRPPTGLPSQAADQFLGKTLTCAKKRGDRLDNGDVS